MAARSRFSDFINQELVKANSPITIIGVGGIGSRIGETLAEIGFDLSIWDDDIVKTENIGSQKFGYPDLGRLKVEALKTRWESQCQVSIDAHPEKYSGQKELSGIVIVGVDSKETRAKIWEFAKYNPLIPLYLDGRVGGERYKLFALNPCDPIAIEKYETHLDLSKPAMQALCTAKFAPQAGLALEFYIWTTIKEFITGHNLPFEIAGKNFDMRMHP